MNIVQCTALLLLIIILSLTENNRDLLIEMNEQEEIQEMFFSLSIAFSVYGIRIMAIFFRRAANISKIAESITR
jgi:fucose 4-O-acetylase-like acetyltransferase